MIACKKSKLSIEPQPELAVTSNASGNNNGSEVIRNIPVDAVFYNECCNEEIYVTGMAQLVINSNIIHIKVSNITGTGLTTGFTYTSLSPYIETNVFYSNQYEGILNFMLNMKNQDGCSFKFKGALHTILNANGDITTEFENIQTLCH
jgi:hypothetical protein